MDWAVVSTRFSFGLDKMGATLDAKLPRRVGQRTTYHVATSEAGGLSVWSAHSFNR